MAGPTDTGGIAALSVRRPVLALVLNLLIALAGVAALLAVEVRELPDVDRPLVSVRGVLPGASPETMDAQVTSIVEGAVARVTGIRSLVSSSEENSFRIRVEFNPSVDLDTAAADVREAVNQSLRNLPDDVEQVVVVKAEQDAEPIMNLSVTSDRLDVEELTRVIEKDIVPELISVPGVAEVPLFGQRQRVLRVVVDPLKLTRFDLDMADVARVLQTAPLDVPSGSFRSEDQELLVRTDASTVTVEQVQDIIISGTTRIGDVAFVTFAPEDAQSLVYLNEMPVIAMGVVRQAQSNTIAISESVRAAVADINRRYDSLQISVTEDKAIFIRGSVREVLISLGIAMLIVVTTIWLFLASFRAVLIPSVVIPLSLVGTIAAVWLMGFSINIITLLAIVLATGLVVDDSIVVLENIQRRRSEGLGPRAGAVLGTRQVVFAVIATTAVLVSVFVPISMLPSTTGALFREFGLTLAAAVAISSFVALSLVPAMAARFAPPPQPRHDWLGRVGKRVASAYIRSLDWVLRHGWLCFGVATLVAAGAVALYLVLPKELLPPEDRGVLYVDATGPDGVGLAYMSRQAEQMEAVLAPLVESGEGESLFTVVGRYDPNRVRVLVPLAPWESRERSQQAIVRDLEQDLGDIPGARVRVTSPNSLGLRGDVGGIQMAVTGNDYATLFDATRELARALEEQVPGIRQPDISYRPTQPQLSLTVDRRRAADLGLPLESIATTLRAAVAGLDVVDLNVADQTIPIMLETAATTIQAPSDLANIYVKSSSGNLLPLSSVVTLHEESVAAELERHAQRRAIEIDASLASGYPLAEAVAEVRRLAAEILPPDMGLIFLGEAESLEETSREVGFTYGIALLVVFLVLCAQFEGFGSALIIMVIVPFGLAAAVYALLLTGTSINVFSQIGLVMLIGLMAKNGILLVEFADQLRNEGRSIAEAVREAAAVRLRPISMTLLSTILGGLPLILGSGAGSEARAAIGWVMVGGLGLAAIFTLYLTPVVYLGLARLQKVKGAEAERLTEELAAAERAGGR